MEQIETQASDLRCLAQVPVALSDTASVSYDAFDAPRPGSAGMGDNPAAPMSGSPANGVAKRKSIDDAAAQRQTRSKRNRYISIACNECKRRKIKCNGETPCQRCGNLNLACLYAPNCCASSFKESDEFKSVTDQLSRLQDEVKWMSQAIKTMQTDSAQHAVPSSERTIHRTSASAVALSPSQRSSSMSHHEKPHSKPGSFRGLTSMEFNLDVANNTISTMGYSGMQDTDDQGPQESDAPVHRTPSSPGYDPLLDFDTDDMVRLCRFHEYEIGIMYPVLNIDTVIAHANSLGPYLESARKQQRPEPLNDDNTLQLKMVLCCALVTESHGHSERAVRLYESMESVVNRKLMSDASHVKNLPLLCLLAGYRFLSNDEILSWRVIGQVMRLCMELGLHQKRGLVSIQDDAERKNSLNSFWSAYVLDRRWAFGTGLPFAVQDDEIDPNLPLPEEYPFLVAMITYSRIGAKVWRQVSHFGPVLARELRQEEIDNLDGEIFQWYENVPDEVKIRDWEKEKQILSSTPPNKLQRLRLWTYLRLNQIRIWLYTPILHCATSIMQNPVQALRVVNLAKDTIRYLSHLNSTTLLYQRAQVFYNQFLASAIAVLFLASVHAPIRFSAVCREEFYMALDLVKSLSSKSWVSQRLWRMIKSLKDVAPRFGLNPDDDAHSSAALGMIGLARGNGMDGRSSSVAQSPFTSMDGPQGNQTHVSAEHLADENGQKMQSELSRIFEGYVGLNGFQFENDRMQPQPGMASETAGEMYTPDGTVFPHFRDLF
ncbi:hypothetical protein E4U34_006576 [Claviceps purpurea]|nr:hypothetical protein E4U34_006576 [Claviceps purpurea]KAG6252962.1 hypothetical protein E4U23_008254 [Claviceps purpurea]KAG6278174.1 hypothetical protein E4U47_006061 [Claviceps purpurea]